MIFLLDLGIVWTVVFLLFLLFYHSSTNTNSYTRQKHATTHKHAHDNML